jgi:hypothetical protein
MLRIPPGAPYIAKPLKNNNYYDEAVRKASVMVGGMNDDLWL